MLVVASYRRYHRHHRRPAISRLSILYFFEATSLCKPSAAIIIMHSTIAALAWHCYQPGTMRAQLNRPMIQYYLPQQLSLGGRGHLMAGR